MTSRPLSLDLFCRVIDNFGDIGVCWRLARHLARDCGVAVRLWVDDFSVFSRIEPRLQPGILLQTLEKIEIHEWTDPFDGSSYGEGADIVIEAFACDLPAPVVAKMSARSAPPVWINLEYLSAEEWVESCHALASIHPETGLKKTLFFPGVTEKTGGLIREFGLLEERASFQDSTEQQNAWRKKFGVPEKDGNSLDLSLFCYKTAPLLGLCAEMANSSHRVRVFVPEGVAEEGIREYCGKKLAAGECFQRGAVCFHGIPFLPQKEYDSLLWTCDLNFVRGEESLVRAIWAGKPLVWNIYPQEDAAHVQKLSAFLSKYSQNLEGEERERLADFYTMWNEGSQLNKGDWNRFLDCLPALKKNAAAWAENLAGRSTLGETLISFCSKQMKDQD